jgi:DNA-binding NarL/FixJ family response regulator
LIFYQTWSSLTAFSSIVSRHSCFGGDSIAKLNISLLSEEPMATMPADQRVSPVRVLVVDDYKEFREIVCLILGKSQKLQVIGEASDGIEAMSAVVELNPDVILLDIDLPRLDGIEAARQIRELAPKSKVIFLSAESSASSVQAAMNVGAWGYVLKLNAGTELLLAVDAVLLGRKFVSTELSGAVQVPEREEACPSGAVRNGKIARSHEARFHSDEGSFLGSFVRFIEAALQAGTPVIAIATPLHRKNLLERLEEHGVDCSAAIEQGRYIPLDVAETLSTFMVNGLPNAVRFSRVAGDLVAASARTALGKHPRVAACGECAHVLWAQGNAVAAIRLEQLWDEIAKTCNVDILCGYILSNSQGQLDNPVYQRLCAVHSAVSPQ